MPAAINTAAAFYQQFDDALDLSTYVPLTALITGIQAEGHRVDVVVYKAGSIPQTPDGEWRVDHVPYVDTGATPPTSGPFVTEAGWTPPAPPSPPDDGGDDSGGGVGN